MRHRVFGKHLGRDIGQRNALRRTLVTQFFEHERITTTRAKAEAIRGAAEHMITQAKRAVAYAEANKEPARVVHIRRILASRLNSPDIVYKIVDELAPRYADRPGGYTRIYHLGPRKGDAAEMVILELVDRPKEDEEKGAVQRVTRTARGLFSRVRGSRQGGESKPAASEGDKADKGEEKS